MFSFELQMNIIQANAVAERFAEAVSMLQNNLEEMLPNASLDNIAMKLRALNVKCDSTFGAR